MREGEEGEGGGKGKEWEEGRKEGRNRRERASGYRNVSNNPPKEELFLEMSSTYI